MGKIKTKHLASWCMVVIIFCAEKYFPRVREIYAKYNWQMGKPDRVYDSSLAQRVLGWNANVTFATVLEGLERGVTSFP